MAQLWTPNEADIEQANVTHYRRWLGESMGLRFENYQSLWEWSVQSTDEFWYSLVTYFEISFDGSSLPITNGKAMPYVRWFENMHLNYAEHIFMKASNQYPAVVFQHESAGKEEWSVEKLKGQVTALQQFLKNKGIAAGDRVAAYMPCLPETTAAFLATASIGAVWSSCSPDFGHGAVVDRFAQIEPRVLFAVDGYHYNGKYHDRTAVLSDIIRALPTLECVVLLAHSEGKVSSRCDVVLWRDVLMEAILRPLSFERVPFNHPLWILYSSGTTGLPKAIVQGHGGILLEQLKYGSFHNDYKPGERCFWYTTTGWMMWNYIQGSLLAGSTMVLYDGGPAYPDLERLWKLADELNVNHFGTSAGFIMANRKAGLQPGNKYSFRSLRSIGSTGSTLPPEGFEWVYREVKKDVWLTSMSGGTDICSAFVGGNPTWPVYAGEIQCRALGCRLEAFTEEGEPVLGDVGEMVVTRPMPSMPLYLWNDPDYKRYLESYFEMYPGVWRHGDWIEITEHQGIIIYGRSDATLNRGGVRIGTSEIYRAVEKVNEVKDSLIVCIEDDNGKFWMPLFVTMKEGSALDDDVKTRIKDTLRKTYSPRHVPDDIIEVDDIPYTISGKKTETPVKKVLMGRDPETVLNSGALRNPRSMRFFIDLAAKRKAGQR